MTGRPEVPGIEQRLFAGVAGDFDKYVAFNLEGRVNSIKTLIPRYRRALREFGAKLFITDGQICPPQINPFGRACARDTRLGCIVHTPPSPGRNVWVKSFNNYLLLE